MSVDDIKGTQIDYVLGTAGHIDHGKSALVQALTGTDPDRLEEEKRRGITIELGFAQLELPNGKRLSVVDVPGHERFVRQMIAGSTGIDGALLCIAADDGIMPQTEEHLSVLELLGIKDCVIALTKADLVDNEWLGLLQEEIAERLSTTPYANAQIIPVSAKEATGLDALKKAIQEMASSKENAERSTTVRMPVDRVFTIKGAGTVVTGTLWSGVIHSDDMLEVLPQKTQARARSLQVHGESVDEALPGRRVAINLQGLSTDDVRPGDFITTPETLEMTDRFDCHFTYLGFANWDKPLKSGTVVHVAHGTKEVLGRLLLFDNNPELAAGEAAFAQIRLNEPLPLSDGDKFIVRSFSPVYVIGGGTVLTAHPKRRSILKDGESEFLEAKRVNDKTLAVKTLFQIAKAPLVLQEIAEETDLSIKELETIIADLQKEGHIRKLGNQSISSDAPTSKYDAYGTPADIQRLLSKVNNELISFHGENPDSVGISKEALNQKIDKTMSAQMFDSLLNEAVAGGTIEISDGFVSHKQAGQRSKQKLQQTKAALLDLLREGGETPPTIPQLIDAVGEEASFGLSALRELESDGLAVKLSKDFYFDSAALNSMIEKLTAMLKEGPATVSQIREKLGSTRKYMIPFVEYCDSHAITRRNGEMRELA